MIASLSGTIQKIEPNSLVIQVGGVGVRVNVPRTVLEDVGSIGRRIALHTHLQVREDDLSLFGFESEDDRELFEVVLSVQGVGERLTSRARSTTASRALSCRAARIARSTESRFTGCGDRDGMKSLYNFLQLIDISLPPFKFGEKQTPIHGI